MTDWPRIGIVVPVFSHSKLVAEAIASVLDQDYPGEIHVVIVVDGDRNPETLQTAASFAGVANRNVSAIFRPNGRLPAARNTGIRFLLARFDDLFAIQFLDADNRLSRFSIRSYVRALLDNKHADWSFPDVTFFGLSSGYSGFDVRMTARRYSPFRHLIGNICEAGSMVRAQVFRKGIFFDESFRYGYEDWEFWLQCLEQGMVGTRAENAGFLYRRRADSMLADSDRMSQQIIDTIRRKHRPLYTEKTAWRFFAEEFRPLLVANADGTATAVSTNQYSVAIGEPAVIGTIGDLYQHFFHVYPPKFILYPLMEDAPSPRFDLKLLKRLVLCDEDERALFLDGNGSISAARSASSIWGAFRLGDFLTGAPPPDELRSHPLISWLQNAVRQAGGEPIHEPFRRYSGPGSFRIEQFLHEMTRPLPEATIEEVASRRRCLLIQGPQSTTDAELVGALSDAFDLTVVNLDDLDHERIARTTVYNGAAIRYRDDGAAHDFIGQATAGFDAVYLMHEFSFLFLAGQWKRGTELVYVAPALSQDERIAMQGMEHSLSTIICSSREMTALAAAGIPAHKLVERSRHIAALGRKVAA
jgi:glycosyltransferase involved in cell wall biosynthesis